MTLPWNYCVTCIHITLLKFDFESITKVFARSQLNLGRLFVIIFVVMTSYFGFLLPVFFGQRTFRSEGNVFYEPHALCVT